MPDPLLANPLVAERAFRASEYWGLTRVALSATLALAKGGLGTHQKMRSPRSSFLKIPTLEDFFRDTQRQIWISKE